MSASIDHIYVVAYQLRHAKAAELWIGLRQTWQVSDMNLVLTKLNQFHVVYLPPLLKCCLLFSVHVDVIVLIAVQVSEPLKPCTHGHSSLASTKYMATLRAA